MYSVASNRMTVTSSSKKRLSNVDRRFIDTVISWSLQDIFNEDLYRSKVDSIDLSFSSVQRYFQSFVYPLLEETRAQLCSSMKILSDAPFAEVISFEEAHGGRELYNVKTDCWKNRYSGHGKELYETSVGDVFILADFKPETLNDLQREGKMWTFLLSARIVEEETKDKDDEEELISSFKGIITPKDTDLNEIGQKSLFLVFLTNIITNRRIWNALHMSGDSKLINKILCAGGVVEGSCDCCPLEADAIAIGGDETDQRLSSELNESQYKAIRACLSSLLCIHKSTVDLICGPPETGKAKTLDTLLFTLLKMNRRTLVCAPTNAAIKEVSSRILSMVKASFDTNSNAVFYALGDILLLGNHERLKVGADIENIYLDYRVKQLSMCFRPAKGWRCYFGSMIDFLENSVSHYHNFIENELRKEQDQINDDNPNRAKDDNPSDCRVRMNKSFLEFVRERFLSIAVPLKKCISVLCTHIAITDHNNFDRLVPLIHSFDSFEALLLQSNMACAVLEELFSHPERQHSSFDQSVVGDEYSLDKNRTECLSLLRTLQVSLGELNLPDEESIRKFCLETSSIIFSTTSSSFKLHSIDMKPLDILVIDEAAQLKECESIIPLLLADINHAILIGDERKLPGMVESSVSLGAGFGRSLFERLSSLGHPNHFLKEELDQNDDLLDLFKKSIWKVHFSDNFLKSFKKLQSKQIKLSVISTLLRLASGWEPKSMKAVDCGNSSQMLKQFKVAGLFVVCSRDIVKESSYTQVLKIWDILPLEDIPKLVKHLDGIFGKYTDDFISRCRKRGLLMNAGTMEIPLTWPISTDINRYKILDNYDEAESRIYVENSKVNESLLLMKFYSLSSDVVGHLLSDGSINELDFPFEVSDEERDIILCPRSTFVLGRSGTGKTTVLTTKLFNKEHLHHRAVEEIHESGLRQLFLTVSPNLCQAVLQQQLLQMKRLMCGGNVSAESGYTGEDIAIQFRNIPDSFTNLPTNSYPLVITFRKFLMMLDGTVGNSFFDRYRALYPQSVALESFIRNNEVTYERFHSLYWPHFNNQHTKKLDASRVFREITSHIKGGMQAMEHDEGKLSRRDYILLSNNRASSLSPQQREIIYDIYENYEQQMKSRMDFDLGDIVADIHHRLKFNKYEGDPIDFVYIDEVQDLTMSQIALLKYVCCNVNEGFVFCGDTAQTIARGIDFTFQDVKSLFYKKFVMESERNNQGKEKEKQFDTFVLNLNFRTHAGVLGLSQNTIELISHFFPHSVDHLKPESSLIYGEAPIVVECQNKKNAIVAIFGGHVEEKTVGFGAEQVILVRDDSARKEIIEDVGKHALVLTLLECKGLEFQDVLLFNFFGSSPLKNGWRVIYEYMNEQGVQEPTALKSSQSFKDSKHNILCSELKQLYVAITRTRQRLWICENTEEFGRPMFDYWKKRCLVQFKKLDDSFVQTMKVASNPEEWKSRGIKLYDQNNYEMATMCFERAGDSYWERKSKAAGLRSSSNCSSGLDPEGANANLREAAEIFEEIGMPHSAAQCYYDLGDHERAGNLYLEKCEEPDLKRAGDCFDLAGCYDKSIQAYAKGGFVSHCLNVCAKGGLFCTGLNYIRHWKQNQDTDYDRDVHSAEQKFLESCARSCLDKKDTKLMMSFVKDFHSMDLKREFLRSLGLLDELICLEEESGNFTEAIKIIQIMGDTQREADMLGKAGKFQEAYELILFYVLANSLWSTGSKGWPLKQFAQKAKLLGRALSFAKEVSSISYELASVEAKILSDEHGDISEIMNNLESSHIYGSVKGEILCLRKLLDAHLGLKSSKYVWEENTWDDVKRVVMKNQVSVETLIYCWKRWTDNIDCVLESLSDFKTQDFLHPRCSYLMFALSYLGVLKQTDTLSDIYVLLIPDATWVMELDHRVLKKKGRLVSVDVQPLVSLAQSYWTREQFFVSKDVLQHLAALYKLSVAENHSEFSQFHTLVRCHHVSNFILSKCDCASFSPLSGMANTRRMALNFLLPRCGRSVTKDYLCIRKTLAGRAILEEDFHERVGRTGELTLGQIEFVLLYMLGSADLKNRLCGEIVERFKGTIRWKEFIQSLQSNSAEEISPGSEMDKELHRLTKFFGALMDSYSILKTMQPHYFLYLMERFLILTSYWRGFFFTVRSSFIEWFLYQDENSFSNLSLMSDAQPPDIIRNMHDFICDFLKSYALSEDLAKDWIGRSDMPDKGAFFPCFVLRLVVLMCLLHLNSGEYIQILLNLLKKRHITRQLPKEFRNILQEGRKSMGSKVIAEALKVIGEPLVIVRLWNSSSEIVCPDAVFVDLKICRHRELMLQTLFPNIVDSVVGESVEASDSTSKKRNKSKKKKGGKKGRK